MESPGGSVELRKREAASFFTSASGSSCFGVSALMVPVVVAVAAGTCPMGSRSKDTNPCELPDAHRQCWGGFRSSSR